MSDSGFDELDADTMLPPEVLWERETKDARYQITALHHPVTGERTGRKLRIMLKREEPVFLSVPLSEWAVLGLPLGMHGDMAWSLAVSSSRTLGVNVEGIGGLAWQGAGAFRDAFEHLLSPHL